MNSILLCEGSTDYALLQYFMREVYGWEDKERGPNFLRPVRRLKKENRELVIGGTGGSSQIIPKLRKIMESNSMSSLPEEFYQKIAIVTDRDEIDTEDSFLQQVAEALDEYQVEMENPIAANQWNGGEMLNARRERRSVQVLLLVVPFEETGALETFLLNAISKEDEYDKEIIEQGNQLVDRIDPEKKYLVSRRYITKAKFDVYFSIRTPAAFFVERQNILKGIDWSRYLNIQKCFQKLENL